MGAVYRIQRAVPDDGEGCAAAATQARSEKAEPPKPEAKKADAPKPEVKEGG